MGSRDSSETPFTRAITRIVSKGIDAEKAKRGSATKHLPPEFRTRNISATARSRSGRIVKRREATNWLKELFGCGRLRTSPHSKAQLCKAFSLAFSRAYFTSSFELSTPRTEISRNRDAKVRA